MLNETVIHAKDHVVISASIWRVYGILLEYCSRGDFQSTVNEIEKQKTEMLAKMEQELDKKLQQISELE